KARAFRPAEAPPRPAPRVREEAGGDRGARAALRRGGVGAPRAREPRADDDGDRGEGDGASEGPRPGGGRPLRVRLPPLRRPRRLRRRAEDAPRPLAGREGGRAVTRRPPRRPIAFVVGVNDEPDLGATASVSGPPVDVVEHGRGWTI